ncbi:MAG: Dehydrogenase-like protein [Candidatus Adlerbacteria bacterium GW2011_GWA2_54_12]|uniref:Dehydrogenase-like protein n=3 Tax=Candidatus Adleribacteriota TaxID=1752736 RepID=A0A0G2A4E7_9BACT|nr:MAG: Dehydrogenase-like protein [Candidatus Adlerbacteria bacterium GW2011_GWA1_54_10]KKW36376.1 MAG: Dehydrogenase-like protein [Candidatus Adlerbacteria bacterium GW2011_GWA2_54_12]KKW37472.1 MAG: Dehydrogenase-like protein [Candidatus Adlerbacteria bacterium GW2011_GWB1_54_7]
MKVKIYGAGSIGNHLAQASRRMGWEVAVVDPAAVALERMRKDIYPARYGAWDGSIELYRLGEEPVSGFDIIMLGTPPDVRIQLARNLISELPQAMLLEKPLCPPSCKGLPEFAQEAAKAGIVCFVGYDHAVSPSVGFVRKLLSKKTIGEILTLDVEFREHWGGIFKAHPWLDGPADTYLGFTSRGGGASGEHSHALHLWHVFARAAGLGGIHDADSELHFSDEDVRTHFDNVAAFTLWSHSGVMGRVVQDVVTSPTRKWARVQGDCGFIEWACGTPDGDIVRWRDRETETSKVFPKNRPDDFWMEMMHIKSILIGETRIEDSPIALSSGIAVMDVLHVAS